MRAEGKRIRTSSIEVRACASLRAFGRVGIIVAKHKHGSVERNRLKRRLRELVRLRVLPTLGPLDVVFRTFPSAYDAPVERLAADVERLARQLTADGGRRIAHGTTRPPAANDAGGGETTPPSAVRRSPSAE